MKRLIKKANWIQLDIDKKQAVNDTYGEGDNNICTWYQKGIISIWDLDEVEGYNGEVRERHVVDGKIYFGNYPIEEWQKFVEDIKQNGVREPIQIRVDNSGIYILEGNHRLEACYAANINEVPVEIRYYGQSQKYKMFK